MINPNNNKSALEPKYYTPEGGIIPESYRIKPVTTQRSSGVAKYIPRSVLAAYLQNNYNSAYNSLLG